MIIIVVIKTFRHQMLFLTLTVLSGLEASFVSTFAIFSGLSDKFCQPYNTFGPQRQVIFAARLPDPHHRPMTNQKDINENQRY